MHTLRKNKSSFKFKMFDRQTPGFLFLLMFTFYPFLLFGEKCWKKSKFRPVLAISSILHNFYLLFCFPHYWKIINFSKKSFLLVCTIVPENVHVSYKGVQFNGNTFWLNFLNILFSRPIINSKFSFLFARPGCHSPHF